MRSRGPCPPVSVELPNGEHRAITMAQLAMLPLVLLLASHAVADIMVQPGYERSTSELDSTKQPIVQPSETYEQSKMEGDPGYHLELHPVYTNSYDIPAHALSSLYHTPYLMPPMSRTAYRRLLKEIGGIPAMPPQYYPFVPPVVHNRQRRSTDGGLDTTEQRTKRSKDHAVAKKSTLEDNKLSVFDAQSQDEKRVNVRQSSGLFGLNPSNMYPYYQQQGIAQPNPTEYDTNSMIDANQQGRANSEAASQEEVSRRQEGNPVKMTFPQVNMENLQHAMLLQRSAPQSEQQQQVEQNEEEELTADSRSVSTDDSSSASFSERTKKHSHQHIKLPDGTKMKVKYPHHPKSYAGNYYPYNGEQYYPEQRAPVYQTAAYQPAVYSTGYTSPLVYYVMPQTYSPLVYRLYWGSQYNSVQPIVYSYYI